MNRPPTPHAPRLTPWIRHRSGRMFPDPTAWQTTGNGGFFRAATTEERSIHGWPEGTFLQVADELFDAATTGSARAVLPLAVTPSTTESFILDLTDSDDEESYIVTVLTSASIGSAAPSPGEETRVLQPTFHTYRQVGFDPDDPGMIGGALIRMTGDNLGGITASGVVGNARFHIVGPYLASKLTLSFPPPGDDPKVLVGQWTDPTATFDQSNPCGTWLAPKYNELPQGECYTHPKYINECNDGIDNDNDGLADGQDPACQHRPEYNCGGILHDHQREGGKAFALLGAGSYCMYHQDNWWSLLHELGVWVGNKLYGLPRVGPWQEHWPPGGNRVRFAFGRCWLYPDASTADVKECESSQYGGGKCAAFSGYVYAETFSRSERYIQAAWLDVGTVVTAVASQHKSLPPIEMAAVLAHTSLKTPSGSGVGSAYVAAEKALQGALVVEDQPAFGKTAQTLAHEFGHSIGMCHDDAAQPPAYGLMNSPSGGMPILGPCIGSDSANLDNNALWNSGMSNDTGRPRPAGFNYTQP